MKRSRSMKVVIFAVLLTACGAKSDRVRVDFTVSAAGRGAPGPLETDFGWSVTLTEAKLHVGPIHFYEGEALLAGVLRALSPIPSAHAHPGHYVPGEALGEMLELETVDLLASEATLLGAGNGVSGDYNSAEVGLSASPELGSHSASVRGRAERPGSNPIAFSAELDASAPVKGIAVGREVWASGVEFLLEIDVVRWVKRIDFDALPAGTSTVSFEPGSQGHNAISRGVTTTAAFVFASP